MQTPIDARNAWDNQCMPETASSRSPVLQGSLLIFLGVIGLVAAFALTIEKFHLLENPTASLSCDFSLLVQCGANLNSPQGSIFGFPNPLIGLMAWPVVITIGVALASGSRFARWVWIGFNIGVLGALAFVIWLMTTSIFALATLCPWCMVTWAVTIPTFYAVTLHLLRSGVVPVSQKARRASASLMAWVPLMAILSYAVILLLAQLRLDAIPNIWQTIFG